MYNKIKVKHKQPEKRNVQKERDFVDNYEAWNHLLVELFKDILDIEEKAVITSEFKDITNNDMHIMEAVGKTDAKNMSAIAKALSVTCLLYTSGPRKDSLPERSEKREAEKNWNYSGQMSEKNNRAVFHALFSDSAPLAAL